MWTILKIRHEWKYDYDMEFNEGPWPYNKVYVNPKDKHANMYSYIQARLGMEVSNYKLNLLWVTIKLKMTI